MTAYKRPRLRLVHGGLSELMLATDCGRSPHILPAGQTYYLRNVISDYVNGWSARGYWSDGNKYVDQKRHQIYLLAFCRTEVMLIC